MLQSKRNAMTARLGLLILGAWVVPSMGWAKPWMGVEPGVTKRAEVIKKFGEPAKTLTQNGKETLAYLGKNGIKGTSQAQFKVDAATGVVERIDVFPGPVVAKDAVEATYGWQCGSPEAAKEPTAPCYVKKLTDDFRTYFMYVPLGIAVFFSEDTKTVHSFIFQPVKPATVAPASSRQP
ncbi:MAG: hypothetical protein M3Y59_22055 [Myxococcota bacterium]|nr:hypothetical protein [Myxococcota bacterium]